MGADRTLSYTTGPFFEGRKITAYLGIVSGEAILGANFVKDLIAGITDELGGRSGVYEKEFERARTLALESLTKKARIKGANAVIGVRFDHLALGASNGMMMVAVTGTAVLLADLEISAEPQIVEKLFLIQINGAEKGPFSAAQLQGWLSSGRLTRETPCRADESDIWSTVGTLLGI